MMQIIKWQDHAQATAPTGEGIRSKVRRLRLAGWRVTTSQMGNQVTQYGLMKLTLVNIYCTAEQPDITVLPDEWQKVGHEPCDRERFSDPCPVC